MKAYLIDPTEKTIVETQIDGGEQSILQNLGCERLEAVNVNYGTVLYLDAERDDKPDPQYFILSPIYEPRAGRGLVVGRDYRGKLIDTGYTLDRLEEDLGIFVPGRGLYRGLWTTQGSEQESAEESANQPQTDEV